MPRPEPVTDQERQRVRELHAEKWSRARIAKELHRGASTIGRIADELGLTWDRTRTAAATEAAQADLAARRADLARLLLDDAYRMRERFWQQYTVKAAVMGPDGWDIARMDYELPPATETRNLVTSVGVLVDKHLALVRADQDTAGVSAVDAWLRGLIGDAVNAGG